MIIKTKTRFSIGDTVRYVLYTTIDNIVMSTIYTGKITSIEITCDHHKSIYINYEIDYKTYISEYILGKTLEDEDQVDD